MFGDWNVIPRLIWQKKMRDDEDDDDMIDK